MTRYVAPVDPAKQVELRAAWRADLIQRPWMIFLVHAARGYDPELFAERLRGLMAEDD
jgi:hypothetical protein